MKLYTLTSDTDCGLHTRHFADRPEAEAAMELEIRPTFEATFPAEAWPGPEQAAERLSDCVGWLNAVIIDEHEIALTGDNQ